MKKIIVIIVTLLICFSVIAKDNFPDVPKKIIVLSQSKSDWSTFITVVDLENNEMVLLEYSSNFTGVGTSQRGILINVIRTGIIIDLTKQLQLKQ